MRNITLIIRREFLTRVQKKSFLLITFLTPALFALTMYISTKLVMATDSEIVEIKIADKTESVGKQIPNSGTFKFESIEVEEIDALKSKYSESDKKVILLIDGEKGEYPASCSFYSDKSVNIDLQEYVRKSINSIVETGKLKQYNIDNLNEILASVRTNIDVKTLRWEKDGEERETSTPAMMIVAYILGFIIYLSIFLFGSMVMRGVIEEKSNRIVELLVSSVRPFQLLVGKITGIALVGITQFLIWALLTVCFYNTIQSSISDSGNIFAGIGNVFSPTLLLTFLFYFIGGYLLYASMFATVGSAVESESETQQLIMPVTIPLILAMMIMMHTFKYPNSDLSVWASMIPFTSPIIMVVRIPFGVPFWQIIVSMTILAGSFVFMCYVASRIYRVGILMYGKKPSLKELIKWFRYK